MTRSKVSQTMNKQKGDPGRTRSSNTRRLLTANHGVSSRFMDSFRAVLEDLEEPEKKAIIDPIDALGEHMTHLLNQSPHFQKPWHTSDSPEEDDDSSIRPLLSSRNWKRLKHHFSRIKDDFMHEPKKKMLSFLLNVWKFFFGNTKSISGGFILFFGLLLITLSCSAVTIIFASFWSLRISCIIVFFASSILVDLKELGGALPEGLRRTFAKMISKVKSFDSIVLQGKRYQGREWNKKDFDWNNAKSAQSSQQYLMSFAPPSVHEGKRLCVDEKYMARDDWSTDTTKHVVAIDFCYVMLREDILQNQCSKLRKAVFGKTKRSDPVMSTTESNGDTITYTRKLNHPSSELTDTVTEEATTEKQRDMDSIEITVSASSDDEMELSKFHATKSPTDAIEVVRQQVFYSPSKPPIENRNEEVRREDSGLSALNRILEEDDSSETASRDGSSIGSNSDATTDLNWMDVGAEIGLKLLGSAAVQKAIASQETAERINTIKEKVETRLGGSAATLGAYDPSLLNEKEDTSSPTDKLRKPIALPVHSMWTSASAAAHTSYNSPAATLDTDSPSDDHPSRQLRISKNTVLSSQSPPRIQQLTYDSKAVESEMDKLDSKLSPSPSSTQDLTSETDQSVAFGTSDDNLLSSARGLGQLSPRPILESIELICNKKHGLISPVANNIISPAAKNINRRPLLLPGVKIVVPMFPLQPGSKPSMRFLKSNFQMATVVSSKRMSVFTKNKLPPPGARGTNCLSVTVKLDKSFLRNGEFAELTFRVMDEWAPRYMPKHSKLPLGSCVATSFGLGVLVGWRVEDDCHVVRSLWQRRGPGSACAYLRRDSIHCTMEAAVGFEVETTLGRGKVVAYTDGGKDFRSGRYFVSIKEEGRHQGHVLELNRTDMLSCLSAQFIPVIEHIREAAQYQLQVDNYKAALQETNHNASEEPLDGKSKTWRYLSKYSDILWKSFLRAIEEDDEFDEGMNEFITSMINFLDRLDSPAGMLDSTGNEDTHIIITATDSTHSRKQYGKPESGLNRFMNDVFGIFGGHGKSEADGTEIESIEVECTPDRNIENNSFQKSYDRAFAVIRTLMRTVSIARAACVDEPNLVLSVCYELLLFVKTVVKVQQKNVSPHSLKVWKRAWEEIVSTFGPVKDRLEKIGKGIAERMEKQGRRAKVRLLRFVDRIVQDDSLLTAMEQGEWDRCGEQIEFAMVKAKIIDEENREHYHKTAQFVYNHFAAASSRNGGAAARNNEKLAKLAMAVQWIAAPRRSILKLFLEVGVLDILERILVRVFQKEDVASRMLSIHASNFHTLRQFRMLKDFTIAGKLWIPLLDAADAEFSWAVSRIPENAQDLMSPLSSLFSLCVVQFHKISEGDLTKDWLDFLMEEEAVSIIHEIDMKLILALESFSRDIKEMMVVLFWFVLGSCFRSVRISNTALFRAVFEQCLKHCSN